MPILQKQQDIYPSNLLDPDFTRSNPEWRWWAMYTRSRREKDLMRKLLAWHIAFYAPLIPRRSRSPRGRVRTSYVPLFPNYVFVLGDNADRYQVMTTNCVAKYSSVEWPDRFVVELRQIQRAILDNAPLTPEAKIEPGQEARVRSGPFKGYEGTILRREGKTRLLMAVKFIDRGISMEIDEGLLEPL
ncbi:MAG TPA: transcription termination/antitermination NusG family protein [Pirellulaceae bacterium]|nr:transcription termination/antitermination NusG family protein [Pirellulaceae bacterium]